MPEELVNRCEFHKGEYIDNRYHVDKILGEGSFGKVYRVTDSEGRVYALKLLKLWEVPAEIRYSLVQRFDMEFQTGKIDSDYLVHSLSYGQVEGNPYILMEYCPGGDLGQFIDSSHPQMPRISKEILLGLRDLHACGKVHRDLKPENVLFKKNGLAALTDFGISGDRTKRMTERNIFGKPQQIFGTYAYMPPEQVNRTRGEATVLPTTDIFSFGVMLYQLLTSELPFGSLSSHNDLVIYQKNAREESWNKNLLRRLPDSKVWETIVEACLIPDFKHRIQSATEVLRLLPQSSAYHESVELQNPSNIKGIVLKVMQGEEFGRIYHLSNLVQQGKRILTMGREENNIISIREAQSAYISRWHCTIEADSDGKHWYIRDGQWRINDRGWYESMNGTYINSTQITPQGHEFRVGDIISIGDVKLRVEGY